MARGPILPVPVRRRPADFALAIVNIVLLLIFFFMLTGSLVQTGEAQIDLAHTENLPLDRLPRPLLLIDGSGAMALNGVAVDQAALPAALAAGPPADTLNVLADADLPADRLLRLMADPGLAGVALRLVTLRVPGDGA